MHNATKKSMETIIMLARKRKFILIIPVILVIEQLITGTKRVRK